VLNLLELAGQVNNFDLKDEAEGKINEIEAYNDEDMLCYVLHIAECIVLGKEMDLKEKGVQAIRNRVVDAVVSICQL